MSIKIAAALGFIGTILAANYVTTQYGMWPLGFGVMATAGTYFAGLAFILRDAVQDTAGRLATVGLIAVGAVLSYALSIPAVAAAAGLAFPIDARVAVGSAVAFLLSESADFAVYTPLRKRGYIRAALASNLVGVVVDTIVFLAIAAPALRKIIRGFSVGDAVAGQLIGKAAVTLAFVGLVAVIRVAVRLARRPVTA